MDNRGKLPNLNHLQIFARIAVAGSATRAAEMVNRSLPTIILAIRKLEEFFGTTLLDRGRTGSHPTSDGLILLARVERLFGQIDDALLRPLTGPPFVSVEKLPGMRSKLSSASIRGLIAIAENADLESAARAASLAKPSLYRIARDVEGVVGRSCFEHHKHGFAANKTGTELARRFHLALCEIDLAFEEIQMARGIVSSRITVGVRRTSALQPLTRAVKEFLLRHPSAYVNVDNGTSNQLLHDLRHGKLDMVYGPLRLPDWAVDLARESFFHDTYAIAVRLGHPLTCKGQVTIEELAAQEWIMSPAGSPRREAFIYLFRDVGRLPRVSIETSSPEIQAAMVAASDRITLMTSREVRELATGVLTTIDYSDVGPRLDDGLITRQGWRPTLVQRHFIETLREHAGRIGAE